MGMLAVRFVPASGCIAPCLRGPCFLAEFVVRYSVKKFEPLSFKVTSVEAADRENFAFLLLYLMPLFTSPLDAVNWESALPVIIVFGAVVATGYNYHFNPLLGFLGWHFYKVGTPEGVTYGNPPEK